MKKRSDTQISYTGNATITLDEVEEAYRRGVNQTFNFFELFLKIAKETNTPIEEIMQECCIVSRKYRFSKKEEPGLLHRILLNVKNKFNQK